MVEVELPDFSDMLLLAESLKARQITLETKKLELSALKADITNFVLMNKNLWGAEQKPPTNVHIKDTFHVVGYDELTRKKLSDLNSEIASLEAEVEYMKRAFDLFKIQTDIWRTQSANQRSALI